MGAIRESVFGSNSERTLFYKVRQRWANWLSIHHNIPFFNVFDKDKIHYLSSREQCYLLMTSIDYVVCDRQDKPMMCIEYDGLNDGHNIGAAYQADPMRAGYD